MLLCCEPVTSVTMVTVLAVTSRRWNKKHQLSSDYDLTSGDIAQCFWTSFMNRYEHWTTQTNCTAFSTEQNSPVRQNNTWILKLKINSSLICSLITDHQSPWCTQGCGFMCLQSNEETLNSAGTQEDTMWPSLKPQRTSSESWKDETLSLRPDPVFMVQISSCRIQAEVRSRASFQTRLHNQSPQRRHGRKVWKSLSEADGNTKRTRRNQITLGVDEMKWRQHDADREALQTWRPSGWSRRVSIYRTFWL